MLRAASCLSKPYLGRIGSGTGRKPPKACQQQKAHFSSFNSRKVRFHRFGRQDPHFPGGAQLYADGKLYRTDTT